MKCKNCNHESGYHGDTLKKIRESKYTSPCKILDCNCDDFIPSKELKFVKGVDSE